MTVSETEAERLAVAFVAFTPDRAPPTSIRSLTFMFRYKGVNYHRKFHSHFFHPLRPLCNNRSFAPRRTDKVMFYLLLRLANVPPDKHPRATSQREFVRLRQVFFFLAYLSHGDWKDDSRRT